MEKQEKILLQFLVTSDKQMSTGSFMEKLTKEINNSNNLKACIRVDTKTAKDGAINKSKTNSIVFKDLNIGLANQIIPDTNKKIKYPRAIIWIEINNHIKNEISNLIDTDELKDITGYLYLTDKEQSESENKESKKTEVKLGKLLAFAPANFGRSIPINPNESAEEKPKEDAAASNVLNDLKSDDSDIKEVLIFISPEDSAKIRNFIDSNDEHMTIELLDNNATEDNALVDPKSILDKSNYFIIRLYKNNKIVRRFGHDKLNISITKNNIKEPMSLNADSFNGTCIFYRNLEHLAIKTENTESSDTRNKLWNDFIAVLYKANHILLTTLIKTNQMLSTHDDYLDCNFSTQKTFSGDEFKKLSIGVALTKRFFKFNYYKKEQNNYKNIIFVAETNSSLITENLASKINEAILNSKELKFNLEIKSKRFFIDNKNFKQKCSIYSSYAFKEDILNNTNLKGNRAFVVLSLKEDVFNYLMQYAGPDGCLDDFEFGDCLIYVDGVVISNRFRGLNDKEAFEVAQKNIFKTNKDNSLIIKSGDNKETLQNKINTESEKQMNNENITQKENRYSIEFRLGLNDLATSFLNTPGINVKEVFESINDLIKNGECCAHLYSHNTNAEIQITKEMIYPGLIVRDKNNSDWHVTVDFDTKEEAQYFLRDLQIGSLFPGPIMAGYLVNKNKNNYTPTILDKYKFTLHVDYKHIYQHLRILNACLLNKPANSGSTHENNISTINGIPSMMHPMFTPNMFPPKPWEQRSYGGRVNSRDKNHKQEIDNKYFSVEFNVKLNSGEECINTNMHLCNLISTGRCYAFLSIGEDGRCKKRFKISKLPRVHFGPTPALNSIYITVDFNTKEEAQEFLQRRPKHNMVGNIAKEVGNIFEEVNLHDVSNPTHLNKDFLNIYSLTIDDISAKIYLHTIDQLNITARLGNLNVCPDYRTYRDYKAESPRGVSTQEVNNTNDNVTEIAVKTASNIIDSIVNDKSLSNTTKYIALNSIKDTIMLDGMLNKDSELHNKILHAIFLTSKDRVDENFSGNINKLKDFDGDSISFIDPNLNNTDFDGDVSNNIAYILKDNTVKTGDLADMLKDMNDGLADIYGLETKHRNNLKNTYGFEKPEPAESLWTDSIHTNGETHTESGRDDFGSKEKNIDENLKDILEILSKSTILTKEETEELEEKIKRFIKSLDSRKTVVKEKDSKSSNKKEANLTIKKVFSEDEIFTIHMLKFKHEETAVMVSKKINKNILKNIPTFAMQEEYMKPELSKTSSKLINTYVAKTENNEYAVVATVAVDWKKIDFAGDIFGDVFKGMFDFMNTKENFQDRLNNYYKNHKARESNSYIKLGLGKLSEEELNLSSLDLEKFLTELINITSNNKIDVVIAWVNIRKDNSREIILLAKESDIRNRNLLFLTKAFTDLLKKYK